jgi:hypothetical protein
MQSLEKTVTTTILPMANMRRTYEGIGIYVDNWKINHISLLGGHKIVYSAVLKGIWCELECCLITTTILPTASMRHTYEGIGMYVDDWKTNPISLL